MKDLLVLRVTTKFLIPLIIQFGIYVQMHGDYGPGGGFQAGVIVAAAIILYSMVFGVRLAQKATPRAVLDKLMAAGVIIYAGVGFLSWEMGGYFLGYDALLDDPVAGEVLGIITIEAGVGITVAAVMLTIYYAFAKRRRERE